MKHDIHSRNNRRSVLSVGLVLTTVLLLIPLIYAPVSAIALPPPPPGWNFAAGGWGKTVDLAPLANDYSSYVENKTGFTLPAVPSGTHVWVYTVYINESNSETFYAGFINFTSSATNFTMPEQLLIHHFITRGGDDAIFAASFTLLECLNKTDNATYGSFTLGKESLLATLHNYNTSIPARLVGNATVTPLTSSSDNTAWNWGMNYQNFVTIWWQMFYANGSYHASPFAVMIFSGLAFNYTLTIVPSTSASPAGNITTRADYTIGNVSAVWKVDYSPNGSISGVTSEPVHSFLANMELSILEYEKTSVYGKSISTESNNINVHNASADVSSSSIDGRAGSDLIYSTDFARKRNYTLYTPVPSNYNTTTTTYPFKGIVDNSIFNDTNGVYALLHRIVSFVPEFFDPKGMSFDTTIAGADAVYTISYPDWGGYKIVNEPYFAVFTGTSAGPSGGTSGTLMIIVAAAALVVVSAFVAIRARTGKRGS